MADLIFAGLKVAYKAVKYYNDKKEELNEFKDDYEELQLRLDAAQPVIEGLEDQLDDSLSLTLTLTKQELEKCKGYIEKLHAYCTKFKGAPLTMIANAVSSFAISNLPDALQGPAQDLVSATGNFGVPEKAFMKFANRIHYLMSTLSAAATTQLLNNQNPSASTPVASTAPVYVKLATKEPKEPLTAEQVEKRAELEAKSKADFEGMSLASLLEENINESDKEVKVILLSGKIGSKYPWMYGVWLDKVPHVVMVTYVGGGGPGNMLITRAPGNEFIADLQTKGVDRNWYALNKTARCQQTFNRCVKEAAKKRNMKEGAFRAKYVAAAVNLWMCMPPILGVYVVLCCARTLTKPKYTCNNKNYRIQIRRKHDLYINNECVFSADMSENNDTN